MATLSTELNRYFFEEDRKPEVKLGDILAIAGERTFGFLFVLLALPSALPIPAPGYSTPFGFLIFILAVQFIIGSKQPWFPAQVSNATIKVETARSVLKKGLPWLRRLEKITKPRLVFVCTRLPGRIVVGSTIALMAISMMIIIPGTNTLPAMGIFLTGLGLVEDDGLIALSGAVFSLLVAALMVSVIVAVIYGGSSLIDLIKELIKG
ncbi:exopolysaccharide biosynthesis protein [Spirulina sp. 06S082]|uniref:exopolysaccharide biosynthesis protein n=1 Tax=Spirulina sp. 06S082 TaxID=3110248 RepID=UPI002B1F83C1|nr:exopolysaccharide biosynthesis protein [Spirulina sp. 06S082]MEA5470439.1 exopolysaccharide biosynthesis protein [Spirulina sp. 06S082]